jgi:hypothetical protein
MAGPFICGSAAARRKLAMTKYVHSRLFLAALVAVPILAVMGGAVLAQDALPDTPKELKDFKLDPEKAPPVREPLPTTEPVVKGPAASVPAPVVKAPVVEVPALRAPASRTPAVNESPINPAADKPRSVKPGNVAPGNSVPQVIAKPTAGAASPVAGDGPADSASAPSELPVAQTTGPETLAPETALPDTVTPDVSTAPAFALPWSYILAALLVAAGLVIAVMFKRRRRNVADAHQAIDAAMTEPIRDAADDHHIAIPDPAAQLAKIPLSPLVPAAAPTLAPTLPPVQPSSNRPKLDISFVPEKASISLANLTIKGRLHIINNGADDAAAMQLNAAVISASEGQGQAISRYFASKLPPGKDLGAAKVGEQIALEMDLMIPISELQTFVMGQQKLLVPIILARVEYQWGDSEQHSDEAQLSCLIGREATPPKPKMGALRLDLGPRSFASLGQRPVPG